MAVDNYSVSNGIDTYDLVIVFTYLPYLQRLTVDFQITFILLMALNFVLVYLVEELFATKRVTRYLDSVKIFLNKAKPEVWDFVDYSSSPSYAQD